MCSGSDIRVIDIKQPVEAHVDAQRDVDQVRVALLQPLIQAGQAGDQLGDVQQLLILFQALLVEYLARVRHAQQVHCKHQEQGRRLFGACRVRLFRLHSIVAFRVALE